MPSSTTVVTTCQWWPKQKGCGFWAGGRKESKEVGYSPPSIPSFSPPNITESNYTESQKSKIVNCHQPIILSALSKALRIPNIISSINIDSTSVLNWWPKVADLWKSKDGSVQVLAKFIVQSSSTTESKIPHWPDGGSLSDFQGEQHASCLSMSTHCEPLGCTNKKEETNIQWCEFVVWYLIYPKQNPSLFDFCQHRIISKFSWL